MTISVKYATTSILLLLFLTLYGWASSSLNVTCLDPTPYKETKAQRKWIEKRMRHHGLLGFVVLEETKTGWVFERDGRRCKL